jgi:hypothetical protein
VHPDRLAAHQEALRQVQDRETQLRNMYPSMHAEPATRPMTPVGPDPALEKRYPSMPGGGVDLPVEKPSPPAAKPAPAERPASPTATSSEPAAPGPSAPAADLPEQYADLTVPENFALDQATFAPLAQDLAAAGYSKPQVEKAIAVYADLQERETAALNAEQAKWRAEVERSITPEARRSIATVMRGAPPEVRDLLDRTGVGDNPHLVRWVAELGRRLGGIADPYARRYSSMGKN